MKQLLILLAILPSLLLAQTAKFYADSTHLFNEVDYNLNSFKKAMEMEWRMAGQVLHFGSKPIEIIPDDKIDTLFYKLSNQAKWDTILCSVSEPLTYKFIYNPCCGAFNIAWESEELIIETVNFSVTNGNKNFLGTLGESAILINNQTRATLLPICKSPMTPNIYQITFCEIEICKDTTRGCGEGYCISRNGKNQLNTVILYRTVSTKLDILFMPLSKKPTQIIYDPKTDTITIK